MIIDTVMPALRRRHGYTLAVLFCLFISMAASQPTDPSEINALKGIKKSLIDPMNKLKDWNKGDPCGSNWTGVWCYDNVGDDGYFHVRELYLMTANLSGTLAPELGQLSQLEILDIMWNKLTGTIPKEIGSIATLKLLLLNGNNLSGSLPNELGNLTRLNRLQVDENQFSGPIPVSFSNMINVKHLHMNNNSFSGQLPPELSKLPNLIHLLVDNNNLSGYLPPEYSMLQGLRILQLDNNNFSGNGIPSTYANLSKLVKLSLRNCNLQGTVPDFSPIANLSYLDLSWNHLTGPLPTNKLSDNMTTINLANNKLNGSIPQNFSNLPLLQELLLQNNLFSGSIPAGIWQNMSFTTSAKLKIDLSNNSLSDILGNSTTPANVTLRLSGNPICKNSNIHNIVQYCEHEGEEATIALQSKLKCPPQACPTDTFFEYVPSSPLPCFCAAPLKIGYRLKSPSFSYFPPYITPFESYITDSLDLDLYQLSIASYAWEEGPRLRMYLKIFPSYKQNGSHVFNVSEVRRITGVFTSWKFPRTDFFGPYELMNLNLDGPYANLFNGSGSGKSKTKTGVLVAAIVAGVACVLAISALIYLLITRKHIKYQSKLSRKRVSTNISIKIDGVKAFTFKELSHATDKFDSTTKVGEGGYGNVYKGILSDETFVAIKRAEEGSLQGQKEFLTEIELLSRIHHRNLVQLIGYCNEEGEQMLVYEFMPNGTLRDWISAGKKRRGCLSFVMRLRIAMGAAKGILYLHTEANPPIFHRDIKASNILLDSKFTAKVADFGLSRLAPFLEEEGTVPRYVSTVVKGTPGYLDPEYLLTHKLTDKCDVYSLGIVNMARQSGTIDSIIDSNMGGYYPSDCVDKFLSLALSCCHDNPEQRPSMLDVVRELEDIMGMLPETETSFSISDITSDSSGKMAKSSSSASASTSNVIREELHMSSYVSGSDLVSGVVPTIVPR
ncbi:hypothetical protein PIB30_027822 [Stylosanthes scabra]|uniref:non-specific serine/threonine protein kinase n=1 Tax=Stylosanthes scabra TaxID=79078 RepID=A0ABU6TBU3_9FABA|nr:hypothetical protein [Stylosanthes scabra]